MSVYAWLYYMYVGPRCSHTLLACFPFSGVTEPPRESVNQAEVSELKNSLERVEKELQLTKERKASLERECVIYQSQLDVSCTQNTYMYM